MTSDRRDQGRLRHREVIWALYVCLCVREMMLGRWWPTSSLLRPGSLSALSIYEALTLTSLEKPPPSFWVGFYSLQPKNLSLTWFCLYCRYDCNLQVSFQQASHHQPYFLQVFDSNSCPWGKRACRPTGSQVSALPLKAWSLVSSSVR